MARTPPEVRGLVKILTVNTLQLSPSTRKKLSQWYEADFDKDGPGIPLMMVARYPGGYIIRAWMGYNMTTVMTDLPPDLSGVMGYATALGIEYVRFDDNWDENELKGMPYAQD